MVGLLVKRVIMALLTQRVLRWVCLRVRRSLVPYASNPTKLYISQTLYFNEVQTVAKRDNRPIEGNPLNGRRTVSVTNYLQRGTTISPTENHPSHGQPL